MSMSYPLTIYRDINSITQPEMSKKLLDRKLTNLVRTGATVVASANPGCSVQLEAGLRLTGKPVRVAHPISLLAEAFRRANSYPRGKLQGEAASN